MEEKTFKEILQLLKKPHISARDRFLIKFALKQLHDEYLKLKEKK